MTDVHTVLIVDDEEMLRDSLARFFTKKGYTTLTAESGSSAVEVIRQNTVDVVISDMQMPDGDGMTIIDFVQSEGRSTKVIFVTGFSRTKADEAVARGAVEVVQKPYDRKYLLSKVQELVA